MQRARRRMHDHHSVKKFGPGVLIDHLVEQLVADAVQLERVRQVDARQVQRAEAEVSLDHAAFPSASSATFGQYSTAVRAYSQAIRARSSSTTHSLTVCCPPARGPWVMAGTPASPWK